MGNGCLSKTTFYILHFTFYILHFTFYILLSSFYLALFTFSLALPLQNLYNLLMDFIKCKFIAGFHAHHFLSHRAFGGNGVKTVTFKEKFS